jgi:hypothetical protein
LHALLQFQRESLVRKVDGLDESAARWSPVGSGTNLLWLITHMAGAEARWGLHRFAGLEPVPSGGATSVGSDSTLAAAVAAYREGWQRVDAVAFASAASLDELCRRPDAEPPATLRWVLNAPAGRDRPARRARRHHPRADRRQYGPVTTGRLPGLGPSSRS